MFARRVLKTINPVIAFTREKSNLSAQICQEDFCQRRLDLAIGRTRLGFGTMGTQDKAKHL
jgi:hypothetical protein